MSREDQVGAALKRARRATVEAEGGGWFADGDINPIAYGAAVLTQLAVAEETARLAEEQRTANLIAVVKMQWAYGQDTTGIQDDIFKRLGLRS